MNEIRIFILVLLAVGGLAWFRTLPPDLVFIFLIAAIELINVGMTVINCIQARHRDPRFLAPGILATVQILTGLGLFPLILLATGIAWMAAVITVPFVIGGLIAGLFTLRFRRRRN